MPMRRIARRARDEINFGTRNLLPTTVAQIVQECETTPDDVQMQSLRRECPHCGGDGWRIVK